MPSASSHSSSKLLLHPSGGLTLIELLITIFIISVVITGLFGLFALSLRIAQENEQRIVGLALANEKIEMVRNLPYVQVGTQGGVPSGSIPQQEVVVRNGVEYTVKTDIRYVDDPYDGVVGGGPPENGKITICHQPGTPAEQTLEVPEAALDAHLAHGDTTGACGSGEQNPPPEEDTFNADYKQVRVEVTWQSRYELAPLLIISYVAPDGIEGGEAGGTLDFQALNSAGGEVSGATVTLVNDTLDPPIDITTQTNEEGRLVLPGLPPASGSYELSVTADGYTLEQTHDQTTTFFPDVDHQHLTVIAGKLVSKTFFIDFVSDLSLETEDEAGKKIGNIAYQLRGTKTIGVDENGDSVYLVDDANATNSAGKASYDDLVWDSYDLIIDGVETGYDIKETSVVLPLVLAPGQQTELDITLVPHTPYSLHVTVVSTAGEPVDNATVHLTGSGFDESLGTGVAGQVFFADLPGSGTYTIDVDAPGFEPATQQVDIEGTDRVRIELPAST